MSIQHMQTVFDAGDLTASQKAVLLAYCNFTDAHGYCWPGVERIADMTGLSVSGVKKVRKQLLEAKLLTTVSRGKKGGGRKTNGSRINVKKLQKMKLPPRDYDDNLMPELGFEEDDEPDTVEAKVPEGHTNGSPGAPQKYLGGTNEGTCGDPYPSVDPSGDPSSSSVTVEDITHEAAPPAVEKKTKRESPEDIVKTRLASEQCTDDEATAVADYIEQQGDSRGERIRSLTWWVTNREERLLAADLAHVRKFAASPPLDGVCSEHNISLAPGNCSACAGDMAAGDFEVVRRVLARDGAARRPDLARRAGAPQAPSEGSYWESQMRRERRARSGYVGGARAPVPTHEEWEEWAGLSSEEALKRVFG